MSALENHSDTPKKPFPLNVVPTPKGWAIAILLESGQQNHLLKPGWETEANTPYTFETEGQAWSFIKQLFNFCLQQAKLQHTPTEKIRNCPQCGKVFKAMLFEYCPDCLQKNEFLLQQLWQGFYYLTGSKDRALQKAAFLLKIPYEEFANVPDAFQLMVQRHLAMNIALEEAAKSSAGRNGNQENPFKQGLHSKHWY